MREVQEISDSEALLEVQRFRKCLSLQVKLQEILRSLGSTADKTCLDVGADNGMISRLLRTQGGTWHTAVSSAAAAGPVKELVGDNVHVLQDKTLPFDDKMFDTIVVVGALERVRSDTAFIEECHRILKADGRLIVHVAHWKAVSATRVVRKILGLTDEKEGWLRPGYTEPELFTILKAGFNVHVMRSYMRFFMAFTDTLVRFLKHRMEMRGENTEARLRRLYSVAAPFYRVAFQMDFLLFFTRGHYLIAVARRRTWRPRKAPVLVDGRRISEAVLSKAAD